MNNDKDTDRLLGKKLGSYEAKPLKLTFDALHKNYLKEKKLRFRNGMIRGASVLLAAAGIIALTCFFVLKNNHTSAAGVPAKNTPAIAQTLTSENDTPTENRENSSTENSNEKINTAAGKPLTDQQSNTTLNSTKALPVAENISTDKSTSDPGYHNKPAAGNLNETAGKTSSAPAKERFKKSGSSPSTAGTAARNNATENKNQESLMPDNNKTNTKNTGNTTKALTNSKGNRSLALPAKGAKNTPHKSNAAFGNEKEVRDNEESSSNIAENNHATQNNRTEGKRKKAGAKKTNKNPVSNVARGSNATANNGKQTPFLKNKEDKKNDQPVNSGKTIPVQPGQNDQETTPEPGNALTKNEPLQIAGNEGSGMPNEPAITDSSASYTDETIVPAMAGSVTSVAENTAAASSPTPEPVTSKKTSGFIISTEVLMNTVKYKIEAKNNTGYDSIFNGTHSIAKNRMYSGAALLGFKYKNAGFNTGIGVLNIETTVDSRTLAKTYNTYTMNLNITRRDSVIPIYNDTAVIGHYTLVITKIDTSYNISGKRSYVIVNGDSVAPQTYVSSIRFVTIPLQLNYSFNLLKSRLVIEPQVGLQIGIPQRSYQFVSASPYDFSYAKTQKPLRPRLLFYDLSLKVNYRFGRNAFIYLKQGYFFNSKNIYDNNYLLKYSLKNIYTAFGVSVLIN